MGKSFVTRAIAVASITRGLVSIIFTLLAVAVLVAEVSHQRRQKQEQHRRWALRGRPKMPPPLVRPRWGSPEQLEHGAPSLVPGAASSSRCWGWRSRTHP